MIVVKIVDALTMFESCCVGLWDVREFGTGRVSENR
jgi:hypothetical protein